MEKKSQSIGGDVDLGGGEVVESREGGDVLASMKREEVRGTWIFVQLGTLAPVQTSPARVIWLLKYFVKKINPMCLL